MISDWNFDSSSKLLLKDEARVGSNSGYLGKHLVEGRVAGGHYRNGSLHDLDDFGSSRAGNGFGQRVANLPHLVDIKKRFRPRSRRHYATLLLCRMADAYLVVDIAVGNGNDGEHEIRDASRLIISLMMSAPMSSLARPGSYPAFRIAGRSAASHRRSKLTLSGAPLPAGALVWLGAIWH